MATNTYVALDTKTIATAATSVEFTSVPQGYTDLVLSIKASTVSDGEGLSFQVGNGTIDTTTNYSRTLMSGANDTNAAGSKNSNQTSVALQYAIGIGSDQTSAYQVHFMNYSNTSIYKTFYINSSTNRGTSTNKKETMREMALWRSFSAIDRIKVTATANMNVGSTFTLYGIAADTAITSTAKATGGTITHGVEHTYHVFTASGTFTPSEALTADVLVVAGGGAGGGNQGGGGGAGGLLHQAGRSLASGTGYTVTIGAGGTAVGTTTGNSGSNSVFDTITALGGGAGATTAVGLSGGSGGGGGYDGLAGGSATQGDSGGATGYGNAGSAHNTQYNLSGAGGGAGTAGNPPISNSKSGAGGRGLNTWQDWLYATGKGVNGYIAGGGGGGNYAPQTRFAGIGGAGGGGAGADTTPSTGTAGTVNTGSGGGGGAGASNAAGAGGSGIVIIRYAN